MFNGHWSCFHFSEGLFFLRLIVVADDVELAAEIVFPAVFRLLCLPVPVLDSLALLAFHLLEFFGSLESFHLLLSICAFLLLELFG